MLTPMALMSLSWPPKVCLHVPSRMSHSLAVKSHAPEMKNLKSGDTARDMQSPWCPAKTVFWVPVSISHNTLKEYGPKAIFVSSDCPDMLFQFSHHAAVSSPGAVSRAGEDLAVTEETAAGQVAWPSRETLLYVRSLPVRNPLPLPRSLSPVCAASSRMTFTFPSLLFKL